jgi:hypothetical protein
MGCWFSRAVSAFLIALSAAGALSAPAAAQERDAFTPPIAGSWNLVQSVGQPPAWKPFAAVGYSVADLDDRHDAGVGGVLGVYRDLGNPVLGLLGASAEVYAGQLGERFDTGGRFNIESRAFFVRAGIDWNASLGRADVAFGATLPLRRGGWFRRAGQLRLDYVPGRGRAFGVGAQIPLAERFAGRTRPRSVVVRLPGAPSGAAPRTDALPAAESAVVGELRATMGWLITRHHFLWLTDRGHRRQQDAIRSARDQFAELRAELDARASLLPDRATYEQETEYYHRTLDRAFGTAFASGTAATTAAARLNDADAIARVGRPVGDIARRIVLEEVVLPYNRTVGQYKNPDELHGLSARARARFRAWLLLGPDHNSGGIPPADAGDAALRVFDSWLDELEAQRARIAGLTRDSRMNWLPLALVLRLEDHVTQQQIDGLVERALGRPFEEGNATLYVNAVQFQVELLRSIHETRSYHVLWIHDYRGRHVDGTIDRTAFTQTVHGYLRALLDHVRGYDETGVLPVYMLILDQHSYEHNDARIWLDLLERPLTHRMRLPRHAAEMQQTVQAMQDSLRAAVAASQRLRADAGAFGEKWVAGAIKVHVNITNPSDFSFRTPRLLGVPFGADNLLRDHRKIVIRDITEADPAAGEMMLAGVGVGDWYNTPTWDDRALLLQGPAAVEAKDRARDVLERHGLTGNALPAPLRPLPRAPDHARRVAALVDAGAGARALQTHNRTGWGEKEATFVQMLLYDLAPAGTVIYVPDSIWTNYEWMAQLLSAALRGCRVYIVAPSITNAPSAGFPQLSVMQELFTRVVIAREQLGSVIAAAGGDLRIGLYTRAAPYDDVGGLLAELEAAFERNAFLNEIFPFSDQAWAAVRTVRRNAAPPAHVDAAAAAAGGPVIDVRPKLHRKTQLIASAAVLRALAAAPQIVPIVEAGATSLADGMVHTPELGPLVQQERVRQAAALPELYHDVVEPAVRSDAVLYFLAGSLNKDARSMALDGEVAMVLGGAWALQPFLDFVLLSGGVTWIESVDELEPLLPPYPSIKRWIGRRIRSVL